MASKKKSAPETNGPGARVVEGEPRDDDDRFDRLFRPKTLSDFVGQDKHKDNLRVYVEAARKRGEPLDHILLSGPPGLGKTTLAHILAHEMGVNLFVTSGPAIDHKGTLSGVLTRLARNDILFIDEIHRLSAPVEETLYPAIEDFRIDVVTGDGPYAESIRIDLRPFTLIGATARAGLLTQPMHERFGVTLRLDFYPASDLERIIVRNAKLLGIPCELSGARELARRARGTPRVANRLLRRVRDFAQVRADGNITPQVAHDALRLEGIDELGLDRLDHAVLRVIKDVYNGGPVRKEALAATL